MTLSLLIETQRSALVRLVAMLFGASGLCAGKPAMLSRIIRGSVLHQLRPTESAVRRLIVALAKDVVVRLRAVRPAPSKPIPRGTGERAPVFPLFDRRRRVGGAARQTYAKGAGPRLSFFDGCDPVVEETPKTLPAQAVSPDAPVDSARLLRRMQAVQAALEDLPKQARRLARMQARRKLRAIRPGRPPGHRARGRHEIDDILRECHQIALMALAAPDTS